MRAPRSQPSDHSEIELIRSLYDALMPSVIMSLGFLLCGGLILWRYPDRLLNVPYFCGLIASIIRLTVSLVDARRARAEDVSIARARALEQRFAIAYVLFAIMLGLFGARALMLRMPSADLLTMVMVIGYCAGVAAGVALRPKVAIASMAIAVLPPTLALLARGDEMHVATGLFTAALLVGGIGSVRGRHRHTVADIDRRIAFATLARHDDLTALRNRLGLREWYAEHVGGARAHTIAVLCLDLDGFKPVNDAYGHPVGDLLLIAVARRLEQVIREGDVAARLGGDEFAIIQRDVATEGQARQLADRIVAALARPFAIEGLMLSISTCVGYVIARDAEIEMLLSLADEALYDAKRTGPGITAQLEQAAVPEWMT